MRYLLILSLLCSSLSWGVVTHVQSAAGFMSTGTVHADFTGACASTATSCTFSFTPTTSGDAIFFYIGCSCASTTNVIALTATSWTITAIPCTGATSCTSGTYGTTGNRAAAFWAYAPNTSAATFTANWAVSAAGFANSLQDEFSGMDATNAVDASTALAGSGSCSTTVTPSVANDGLWGACNDTVTAVGAGFTKGADDTSTDWTEWQILSGGSGAAQTVNFTGSGTWELMAVAVKAAGGGGGGSSGFISKRKKLIKLGGPQ